MYIRTKDGVYEVKVNKYHELVYCKNNQIVLSCNILKQSENLEELCDGYYMDKDTEFTIMDLLGKDCNDVLRRNIAFLSHNKIIVKAFIKTDKVFIYVAKMDENGELVLI